jgi:uncharacterized protein YndB with AHSA1/START domain
MIDGTEHINAVRRTVGSSVLEAGEARVVTIARTYDAPQEDVWDACTDASRIARWFLPVSGDLRLGGRFQLEGNAAGTVQRCDPPKGFATTWEFGGNTSWIEVRLTPDTDGGTRLELEHLSRLDEHWTEFGPGAVGIGWEMGLIGLTLHLSSGEPVDPAEAAAWAASEDGRRFMTLSSLQWCEANIAGGENETAAREAADRTTAAYTAIPPLES